MKTIVLLGAGKSAHVLIHHLAEMAEHKSWQLFIGDIQTDLLGKKLSSKKQTACFTLNLQKQETFVPYIQQADLVISMLPAMFHPSIAAFCLEYKKHLITPSYISDEMAAKDQEAKDKGLIFLNEIGLDPGIDHMSAMKIIHELQDKQCEIISFKSYCGGLIAPESDTNPWKYKFTWNPRNVVLAGQGKGGIKYLADNQYKYIPYFNLFKHYTTIEIEGVGKFEGYPNRDSLKYQSRYGLDNTSSLIRGTLRKQGFCDAWDVLIQLGMTEDSYSLDLTTENTHADFLKCFLTKWTGHHRRDLESTLRKGIGEEVFEKIMWLGLFDETKKITVVGTPAQILQSIIEPKLALSLGDKDMVVMHHEIIYKDSDNIMHQIDSSMTLIGKDEEETAMALTVGLPIAIASEMILENKIATTGVIMPIEPAVYIPILESLATHGIHFSERHFPVTL